MFETLISIVIFAVGIVGLIGAFLTSTKLAGENRYRTEVVAISNELLGEMSVADHTQLKTQYANTGTNKFADWKTKRVGTLPKGNATINFPTTKNGTVVALTVTWSSPGGTTDSENSFVTKTYFP